MNEAELRDLETRISAAGGLPSAVNDATKTLLDAGVLTEPQALTILEPLRKLTPALERIQDWRKAALLKLKDAPTLKPGEVVVDVGTAGTHDDGLVPLSGADLADIVWLEMTGRFNPFLADRLGGLYTDYVNAYGKDGRWFNPTMMVLATNPAIRRTYPSPRVWGERNGLYHASDLPEQWEGFEPTFAGGHTLPLPG